MKVMVMVTFHNFSYVSAIHRAFFLNYHNDGITSSNKKDIISADLENVGKRTPFAKIAVSEQLYNRFLPNFHRNDGHVVGKKSYQLTLKM